MQCLFFFKIKYALYGFIEEFPIQHNFFSLQILLCKHQQYYAALFSFTFLQEVVLSSFGKACIFGSCIIYVLPPACLAEPCEQEYSLPNMPLLFAIAMVGATVGGKLPTVN